MQLNIGIKKNITKYMDNENRFSVFLLEKDVMEYREYREKFNKYEQKLNTCSGFFFKSCYTDKKNQYYRKYINKMSYLEKKYRCNEIYTNYHSNLEGRTIPEAVIVQDNDYNIYDASAPPADDYNIQ